MVNVSGLFLLAGVTSNTRGKSCPKQVVIHAYVRIGWLMRSSSAQRRGAGPTG